MKNKLLTRALLQFMGQKGDEIGKDYFFYRLCVQKRKEFIRLEADPTNFIRLYFRPISLKY